MVRRMLATASGAERAISMASSRAASPSCGERRQPVGQADGHRLVTLDPASGVEHLERLLLARRPGAAWRSARSRGGSRGGRSWRRSGPRGRPPGSRPPGPARARHRSPRPAPRPRSASPWRTAGPPRRRRCGARRRTPPVVAPSPGGSRRRRRSACPRRPGRRPGTGRPVEVGEGGGQRVDQRHVDVVVGRPPHRRRSPRGRRRPRPRRSPYLDVLGHRPASPPSRPGAATPPTRAAAPPRARATRSNTPP